MAAVTYSAGKKAETGLLLRTGCDIQHVKPLKNFEEIARLQFSPEERGYIAAGSGGPEHLDRFYRIWVLKECFLKARGLSVFDMGTAPSFANPAGLAAETKVPLNFFLYELGEETAERYLLAAAQESGGPYVPSCGSVGAPVLPPEFRWFSEALPLKSIAAIKAVDSPVTTVSPNI
jgi:phosphopantetheinyl transferase (holo-ACP synthase)